MAENEYSVLLGLELNPNSVNSVKDQIKNLKVDPIKINVEFKDTQSQIQKIKSEIQNLGKVKIDFGTTNVSSGGATKQITSEYQNLMSLVKQINSLVAKKIKLNVDTNSNEFKEIQRQIISLVSRYNEARKSLTVPLSSGQSNAISAEFQKTADKIKVLKAEMLDTKTNIANSFDFSQTETQLNSFENEINNLTTNTEELKSKLQELRSVRQSVLNASGNGDYDTAVQKSKEYSNTVNELKEKLKEAKIEQDTISKGATLSNNIEDWMNKNAKAAEKYGSELKELQSQLKEVKTPSDFNSIARRYKEIQSEAKAAGLTTKTFGSSLKDVATQALGLGSTYMVVQKVVQIIKKGVEVVQELDDALIDLKKTTTMSASELSDFYKEANDLAKKYNTSTTQIIQGAADWSRLGYNSKKESSLMTQYSSQMAAISPGMTVDESTEGLVSTMKAYKIEADNVLDGIMSKINEVGNTAATNNKQILTGLKNSASAMAAMDTSLDKTIALFTAGQEIIQDDSKVGNALRSISLRIRGYDEETSELSEDLATITGDVVELTKAASNNNQGISLFTDSSQTQYKDIYEYLKEIAGIIDEIDVKSKQQLMEKLFGKNRANVGAAILSNFSAAEKAMDTMANSAGSADREMSIITESISYHLNELGQTWVGIAQNVFQSDTIKGFIDILTGLSNVIDFLTEHVGTLGTLLASGIIIKSIKSIS